MEKDISLYILWENIFGREELDNQNGIGPFPIKTLLLAKILWGLNAIKCDWFENIDPHTGNSFELMIEGKKTIHISLSEVAIATMKDTLLLLGAALTATTGSLIPASIALSSSLVVSAVRAVTLLPSDDGSACVAKALACSQIVTASSGCNTASILKTMQYRACSKTTCKYFSETKCLMDDKAINEILNFLITKKVVIKVGVETYKIKQ